MEEFSFAKKILVSALVLQLLSVITTAFLAQGIGNIPALSTLTDFTNSLTSITNNIAVDLSTNIIHTSAVSGALSITNFLGYIALYIAYLINYTVKFFLLIFTLVSVIVVGIIMIVYLLTIFLPEIFSQLNLGVFAFIFGFLEAIIDPLIVIYLFSLIRAIISGISGNSEKIGAFAKWLK